MIDVFKKLMEQALNLELTVRLARRDEGMVRVLGDELDNSVLEGLEGYRDDLEAWLCDMDDNKPEDMGSKEFERWADAHESLENMLSKAEDRINELM